MARTLKDTVARWVEQKERKIGKPPETVTVNPYEYPDRRMDDPEQDPKISVVGANRDPIVDIRTIPQKDFKNLVGSYSVGEPKVIRVNSPVFTTQPVLSFTTDDIRRVGQPKVGVIEAKRGTTSNIMPFVNPFTSTNPLSSQSVLKPDGESLDTADPRGWSVTRQYDQLRKRMKHSTLNLGGVAMDILLPSDVSDDFSGTKIDIGGSPGRLDVKSEENGYYNSQFAGGKKIPSKPLFWDEGEDPDDRK
jgi:hypothetical protein